MSDDRQPYVVLYRMVPVEAHLHCPQPCGTQLTLVAKHPAIHIVGGAPKPPTSLFRCAVCGYQHETQEQFPQIRHYREDDPVFARPQQQQKEGIA